jgi:tripartite-type tricarboxylate transporter receptor subunit TctC
MNLQRRQVLSVIAGAASLPVFSVVMNADTYPSRPVRIVVGYAAGGSGDIIARLMAQWLSDRLRQTFIVENKVGAGGNIAIDTLVRASADGHTLSMVTFPTLFTAPLPDNFDLARDSSPIAGAYEAYLVLLVHPSVPATTLSEFIAYAKANPDKLSMGSAGNGTAPHLCGEMFKMMAGVDMTHVPYRGGGPAFNDLLGGQIQVMFGNLPADQHIKTGRLRALAVTTAIRAPAYPELPSISEAVPGYDAGNAFGVVGPKGLAADVVQKLNSEINAALADPKMQARLAELGAQPLVLSPAEFGQFISKETEKWNKVARQAQVKPG